VECADFRIGDRLVSTLDHKLEPEMTTVRRLEVITGLVGGAGSLRYFKVRVVEETLALSAVVSEIARRHGPTPQQVFTWRRRARQAASRRPRARHPTFVPAIVETAPQQPYQRTPALGLSRCTAPKGVA
jgi:transposase